MTITPKPNPVAVANLVIEDQAAEIVRQEEANRQLVELVADLSHDLVMWQAFADGQFRRRAVAEEQLRQLRSERRRQELAA